ncbi:type I-B CRISPR-associated protein Cas7/Cst2/DevR [Candidatus Chlorohelix sp.]|uniref:type I-B CRISPR-associated protein Cas7/Cst2/DevR n=1 Tax=Candidatus Chlorohelix sp. TaxID=3139201 RepID=UPI003070698F
MSFLTGVIFLNAPAAALNNSGADTSSGNDNAIAVKAIQTKEGKFPYVSAQAFRAWLRSTLEQQKPYGWQTSPIDREGKIAYTDGNPLDYWDDDLFGYMRAQGKSKEAKASREALVSKLTKTETTITRVSPLRVSTFMSIAPNPGLTQDFGVMARQEGNPVPHEHQFYHAVLKGLFSLDLFAVGTFSHIDRTGYLNLDEVRIELAKQRGLQHLAEEKSYRLDDAARRNRVAALLEGLAIISGGAKQTLHYTDITPAIVLAMVTKGGNNPLQYVITADKNGLPMVHQKALAQTIDAWRDQIESPLYVGWVEGFCDDQREALVKILGDEVVAKLPKGFEIGHPRQILQKIANEFKQPGNNWLE